MALTIKPGGIIERKNWESGEYVYSDVSDRALFHLMDPCVLDEGVTLRDIFTILQRDMEFYSVIINNWVEEIVAEGLSGKKGEDRDGDCEIDYLELYWEMEAEVGKDPEFHGFLFPQFHGWGTWPEDKFGHTPPGFKGGIGIDFSPSYELIDLPVKLRETAGLTVDKNYRSKPEDRQEFKNPVYSLFHILYGIVWELSFMGSPESRDEKSEELRETIRRIDSGEEKLIPWEEVKAGLLERHPELGEDDDDA